MFVQQIQRCVADPELCRTIGRNAYNLIVEEYGVERLTQKLLDFYNI